MSRPRGHSHPALKRQEGLSNLTDRSVEAVRQLLARGDLDKFTHAASRVGFCQRPIRLHGQSATIDARTGEVSSTFSSDEAPLGVLLTRCGNRRESVCTSCSRVYARDTFEMIRCGLEGGKGVPERVAENPLAFVTVTAPSFGPVHSTRGGRLCHPRGQETCRHGRSMSCTTRHEKDDAVVGSPICSECYDYRGHVVWQYHAPELWRRAIQDVSRQLAALLGVPSSRVSKIVSRQYGRTAEMQARGAVHFHALFRLDGPSSEGLGAACGVGVDVMVEAIEAAFARAQVVAPPTFDGDRSRVLRCGEQIDIRVVREGTRTDDPDAPITGEQVAAYLAKYSTKDTSLAVPDGAHVHRIKETCAQVHEEAMLRAEQRRAGEDPAVPLDAEGRDHYALIGKWTKELGYRGHYSSKSRCYSVTYRSLRRRRARFQRVMQDETERAKRAGKPVDLEAVEKTLRVEAEDSETTLVVGMWEFVGAGWSNEGEVEIATAAAARAREYAQLKASGLQ
ncbi:replication initiator [Janibacter alittae]|uniref:Replication initiator n=1 Tax=Janibacter alittae TaxID=3115209 RepID=A0ABZ2MIC5_9MICO